MKRAETKSYPVSIFMAGDIELARIACQQYCDQWSYCVTVTPTRYIYHGGAEDGFVVGLINYPRFPAKRSEIWRRAEEIASYLRPRLDQDSFTIQAPDRTVWFSKRDQDDPLSHHTNG